MTSDRELEPAAPDPAAAEPAPATEPAEHKPERDHFDLARAYREHLSSPRRERAFLSAVSFTTAFATCRTVTHAIRAGVGPFHNMSAGGRHLHHCTFGIIGNIALGQLWLHQLGVGMNPRRRAASRAASVAYGIATALTLDEFALWFDLQDDYWTKAGRKSIDAVSMFAGLSTIGVAGGPLLRECLKAARDAARDARRA